MADFFDKLKDFANDPLNKETPVNDGFPLSSNIPADGNGLPTSKRRDQYTGTIQRNIIKWFVPEFGIVSMYVNPESISYNYKKLITSEKTKGGYSLQYWGEELTTLSINGTTGSSGIEGINLLYEIYRAEQYALDGAALKVEAANNNAQNLATQAIEGAFGKIGSAFGGIGESIGSTLGSFLTGSEAIVPRVNPSLAQYAFTVEMYYGGAVFRGYFTSFVINEKASSFALDYNISFTVTQQRGYRSNYFPFHKNPYYSPTEYRYGSDNSFKRQVKE